MGKKTKVKVQQKKGKLAKEVTVSLQIVRSTTESLAKVCPAAVPGVPMKNHVTVQFVREQTHRNHQNIEINLYLDLSS